MSKFLKDVPLKYIGTKFLCYKNVIALTGLKNSGKTTIADYMCKTYNFKKIEKQNYDTHSCYNNYYDIFVDNMRRHIQYTHCDNLLIDDSYFNYNYTLLKHIGAHVIKVHRVDNSDLKYIHPHDHIICNDKDIQNLYTNIDKFVKEFC